MAFLPSSQADYLDAPFPFVVGMSEELWTTVVESKWEMMEPDVISFNLETGEVMAKSPLPDRVEPYGKMMIRKITDLTQSLKAAGDPLSFEATSRFELDIRQAFLSFLVLLIGNFEEFYFSDSKYKT